MAIAGLFLTCQLCLAACQSQSSHQSDQPKTKQTSKKVMSKKAKSVKKAREGKKERKGVAGVDFPTDDGFLLTKDSKILSKTDQGIIVDHDGHSHFVFYADLKGSPFEYLIPKGANVTKPAGAQQSHAQVNGKASGAHHHYEFNPADIVAEDAPVTRFVTGIIFIIF